MISGVREREIIRCAKEVLDEAGVTELAVSPKAIASAKDIAVMPWKPDRLGISGFLMKMGDNFGIGYSSAIGNKGFENFTVAHELAHYFLDGHIDLLFAEGKNRHYSHSGFISDVVQEREADRFASELLMPEHLFRPALRKAGVGFRAIETLASKGETSLVATALRYAKFADDPTAIIMSTGNQIDWCALSPALLDCKGVFRLPKKTFLPTGSATAKFNRQPSKIDRCERVEGFCSLSNWFEDARDMEMQEDVIGLGHYGKTLTVLFTEEAIDSDDDDEEEDRGMPSSRWRDR